MFDLDEALTKLICHAMENRELEQVLDTTSRSLVPATESDDSGRYLPLPRWESSDGYLFMEEFAASVRHPGLKAALHDALHRGKGVFRAYKDALSQYPLQARAWYERKDRALRQRVFDWYNDLRELQGLAPLARDYESPDLSLVLVDFTLRRQNRDESTSATLALLARGREELGASADPLLVDWFMSRGQEEEAILVVLESLDGNLVGAAQGRISPCQGGAMIGRLVMVMVEPEYRSTGLGSALGERLARELQAAGCRQLVAEIPPGAEGFGQSLHGGAYGKLAVLLWR